MNEDLKGYSYMMDVQTDNLKKLALNLSYSNDNKRKELANELSNFAKKNDEISLLIYKIAEVVREIQLEEDDKINSKGQKRR